MKKSSNEHDTLAFEFELIVFKALKKKDFTFKLHFFIMTAILPLFSVS